MITAGGVALDILHSFRSMLDIKGIKYVQADDSIQMVLCSGPHKWKCAVTAGGNGFLCIYNRYPWKVPPERTGRLLSEMNVMNEELAAGCFMVSGDHAVFRYSLHVADPLFFTDTAAEHFASAAATTDRAWDKIYSALFSAEV